MNNGMAINGEYIGLEKTVEFLKNELDEMNKTGYYKWSLYYNLETKESVMLEGIDNYNHIKEDYEYYLSKLEKQYD